MYPKMDDVLHIYQSRKKTKVELGSSMVCPIIKETLKSRKGLRVKQMNVDKGGCFVHECD